MADVNPYEPPREGEPLTTGKVVKRSVGVAAVILLTPPAMVVTVFVTCNSYRFVGVSPSLPTVIAVPIATLTVLMLLAAVMEFLRIRTTKPSGKRIGIFSATPVVVGLALVAGYVLAFVAYALATAIFAGAGSFPGFVAAITAFWTMPALVLFVMLRLAWRTR